MGEGMDAGSQFAELPLGTGDAPTGIFGAVACRRQGFLLGVELGAGPYQFFPGGIVDLTCSFGLCGEVGVVRGGAGVFGEQSRCHCVGDCLLGFRGVFLCLPQLFPGCGVFGYGPLKVCFQSFQFVFRVAVESRRLGQVADGAISAVGEDTGEVAAVAGLLPA